MPSETLAPRAWLILAGHRDVVAQLRVVRYPVWSRAVRTVGIGAAWATGTVAAFFVTLFDPFLSSIPAILGLASVWRSWRGHYRVSAFEGACPRCDVPLALAPGTRIRSPHPMVCYHCHHEPYLAIGH